MSLTKITKVVLTLDKANDALQTNISTDLKASTLSITLKQETKIGVLQDYFTYTNISSGEVSLL